MSYELAKLASKKGFKDYMVDTENIYAYCKKDKRMYGDVGYYDYPTVTLGLFQRWMREEMDVNVFVTNGIKELHYDFEVYDYFDGDDKLIAQSDQAYQSYDEALEAGLFEALNYKRWQT